MKRILVSVALILLMVTCTYAQNAPVLMQQSAALEGSHQFNGRKLYSITVTWHSEAARWLMLFDATLPADGSVTPYYCVYVQAAGTQADGSQLYDFSDHPLLFPAGPIQAVLSTNSSGCFSKSADSANDSFWAQVQ
jgi:hypothetical protein